MLREEKRTVTGTMQIREKVLAGIGTDVPKKPVIEWQKNEKRSWRESLLSNLAVASALLICIIALRTGAAPSLQEAARTVTAAATGDSLLDDQLGRLSFVSALFPEAAMVFGSHADELLAMPVMSAAMVHAWSEAEPYTSWETAENTVTAAAPGEVIGVYHGNGDERLVQVRGDGMLSCLYGNLCDLAVTAGDRVEAGDVIGTLMEGEACVLEVRRNGVSIDPALYFAQ